MKKVYVFLADGFEDVEALIPVDVLRRGGVDVTTVSISDFPLVTSAHGVNIEADIMFEQGESVPHLVSYWDNWDFLKARKLPAILVSSRCLTVPPILPTSLPSMATSPRLKVLLLPSPSPTSS